METGYDVVRSLAKMLRMLVIVRCPVHRRLVLNVLAAIEAGEQRSLVVVSKGYRIIFQPALFEMEVLVECDGEVSTARTAAEMQNVVSELRRCFNLRWQC